MKMKSQAASAALTLAVLGIFSAVSPLRADLLDPKRGLGDTGASYGDLQAENASWYYTWGTGAGSPGTYNANFYPMFWSAPSQTTINAGLAYNPNYILGFNEPDVSSQSNMSVAQALSSWSGISSSTIAYNTAHGTNVQLVSPAVSDTSTGEAWLQSFMSQATTAGYKVDAVAFHWYDDDTTNGAQAAADFESKVLWYHNTFNKPVFITEFADHDWGGTYSQASMIAANAQMLSIVIPWMDSQSFVLGYSYYNWFSDSSTFTSTSAGYNPTTLGATYNSSIGSGNTTNLAGINLGEHVADLTGGTLTMSGSTGTVNYINALGSTSYISGNVNWGLNLATNWVRVQPAAVLVKTSSNTITFAGPVADDGTLQLNQGVLRLSAAVTGVGSLYIYSDGGATGSTGRFELTGNINIANPITYAQRTDPSGSDGIRNVSGNNTLSGPLTITVGGNQARIESDAGLLTLAGPISTNATSSRNFYLQGAGNGTISGVISDNPSNAAGQINLYKQGTGTWTLTGANTYTGNTTISAGTLRLDQTTSASVIASAVANYTFDSTGGITVLNSGTGGTAMNGVLANGATIVSGGRFGNALSLTSGASLNISNPIESLSNTGTWTVSAWVKTATAGATIVSKSSGGWASGNSVFYLGDGTGAGSGGIPSAVRYAGGFYQGSTAATSVTDNTWHLVTYVDNAGNYAVYVDGAAQSLSSGSSSFSNADVGSIVRIGLTTDTAASDGSVNFSGLLDNVQFYNQALTAPQIAALYQGTNGGVLPSASNVSIASGATLDLNNTSQQIGSLSGPAGSLITLGTGQLTFSSANNSSFAGNISGSGGSLLKAGISTLTLNGTNTYTGNTTINTGELDVGGSLAGTNINVATGSTFAVLSTGSVSGSPNLLANGTVNFNAPSVSVGTLNGSGGAITLNTTTLTVNTGGSFTGKLTSNGTSGSLTVNAPLVTDGVQLNALTLNANQQIRTNGTSTGTSFINALNLAGSLGAWTSGLDLTNNKLIVEDPLTKSTTITQLQDQVVFGTTHTAGVYTSTVLPANMTLAVIDNAVTGLATFGGLAVDSNSVLVGAELVGDTNIDGKVDLSDLNTVLNNLGSTTSAWTSGNFDHAATIDLTDLNDVLNNLGLTNANASSWVSGTSAISATPEPASLSLLGGAAAALFIRRRSARR